MIALPSLAGLLVGILVNLCADALNRGRSTADVDSAERPVRFSVGKPACAFCGQQRSVLAWSGLLAYLTGRRRCSACTRPLSLRHPLVEGTMIVVYALIWALNDVDGQAGAVVANAFYSLYGAILLLILVTDLEHHLVPHAVMLPAIVLAIVAAFVNPTWSSPGRSLLGGALGLLCGLTLYVGGILFARLLGRVRGEAINEVAFGFGDVTLLTFIGLIVGGPDVLLALGIGVLSGGLVALVLLILRGLGQKRHTLVTTMPYAPFFILGGTIMLVFGQEIMAWYLRGI